MGNSNQLERIAAKKIASWQRKLTYHTGSYYVSIPKEIIKANLIKRNCKCIVIFSHALDERSGNVVNIFELVSQ